MGMSREKTSSFHVDVGFKLTPETEKRIGEEIRVVVMQELAKIDLWGDLVVTKLPPGTYGYAGKFLGK